MTRILCKVYLQLWVLLKFSVDLLVFICYYLISVNLQTVRMLTFINSINCFSNSNDLEPHWQLIQISLYQKQIRINYMGRSINMPRLATLKLLVTFVGSRIFVLYYKEEYCVCTKKSPALFWKLSLKCQENLFDKHAKKLRKMTK